MGELTEKRARQILGVRAKADLPAIRSAWRALVLRYHPDKPSGNAQKFVAIDQAYDFLQALLDNEDGDFVRPFCQTQKPSPEAKPAPAAPKEKPKDRRGNRYGWHEKPSRREIPIPDGARNLCEGLLSRHRKKAAFRVASKRNGGFYVDPRSVHDQGDDEGNHVGQRILVEAGKISIFVAGKMHGGLNRVSVPAGTRNADTPTLISFNVTHPGTGRIRVDKKVCKAHFPWAKTAEIIFTG